MLIPALAVGDFAITLVAVMVAVYEVALLFMRGRRHGHGWAAGIALGAAVYSATAGVQYVTHDPALVVTLVRIQFVSFLGIALCLVGFAEEATDRRFPLPRRAFAGACGVLAVVALHTDAIVAPTVHPLVLSLHAGPVLVPVMAPLTDLFFVLLLLVSAGAIVQLVRHAGHPHERMAYGFAMACWLSASVMDATITLGVFPNPPMYLLEYGFFLVAASFMAVDVVRYGTLLRASERARADLDHSFRTLIEGLPLIVLVVRGERILHANPAAVRSLGLPDPAVVTGHSLPQLLHPDDTRAAAEHLAAAEARTGSGRIWEARFLRPDRADATGVVVAELTAVAVTYERQPAVAILALDVTEQRLLTARMMGADRMVAVGTLAAGVAHEINNPMTYVVTNLETAQYALRSLAARPLVPGTPSAEEIVAEVADALAEARDGALRVRRIVRDLTMLSRGDGGEIAPVQVEDVLQSAQQVALSEIRYRARLVFEAGPLPPVLGDAARLGQVFLNLLINAAQAIPRGNVEGNEIRVRTSTDERGRASIEIRDTGSGIPDAHRVRVFDPFFTTKPPGQGTGLGLSMCQSIVLAHGGEISFESAPGVGTTFRVVLPRAPDHTPVVGAAITTRASLPPMARTPCGPIPAAKPGRRRVLIIDDEARVGEALSRFLGREFTSDAVTSAQAALARLRDPGVPPYDAILSDLMMPDMTGMEFFEVLQGERPDLAERVIFLTGGAFTQQTRTWMTTLNNPWIEKPPDLQALREAIDQVAPPV
jgi:two-component system cell cycle sensor histidine kinase/response regulator CckA